MFTFSFSVVTFSSTEPAQLLSPTLSPFTSVSLDLSKYSITDCWINDWMDLRSIHPYVALAPLLPLSVKYLLCPILFTFLFLLCFSSLSTCKMTGVSLILTKKVGRDFVNLMFPGTVILQRCTLFTVRLPAMSVCNHGPPFLTHFPTHGNTASVPYSAPGNPTDPFPTLIELILLVAFTTISHSLHSG